MFGRKERKIANQQAMIKNRDKLIADLQARIDMQKRTIQTLSSRNDRQAELLTEIADRSVCCPLDNEKIVLNKIKDLTRDYQSK